MKNAYNSAMEYIRLSEDARQSIQKALTEGRVGKKSGRPVRRLAVLAAVLALTAGSAFAVSARLGVLDVFFQGERGPAGPYVQGGQSVSDGNYRLTVDSALLDGSSLYAVVTVTGLNDRAVDDLLNNRVIAESHREIWGDRFADDLLESGDPGPDAFWVTGTASGSIGSLEAPDGNSRTFSLALKGNYAESSAPIRLWAAFMGREYAVTLDPEIAPEPLCLTAPAVVRDPLGEEVTVTRLEVGVTGIHMEAGAAGSYSDSFSFRLKRLDGTEADPRASFAGSTRLDNGTEALDDDSYGYDFRFAAPMDLSQVTAVTVGGVEIPVS